MRKNRMIEDALAREQEKHDKEMELKDAQIRQIQEKDAMIEQLKNAIVDLQRRMEALENSNKSVGFKTD